LVEPSGFEGGHKKEARWKGHIHPTTLELASYLADEVGEVEDGHDEDGEPFPQRAVVDLRLQPGKKAQRDEVGHGDGEHVGPDEPGHDVAVEQHVWQGRAAHLSQNPQPYPYKA